MPRPIRRCRPTRSRRSGLDSACDERARPARRRTRGRFAFTMGPVKLPLLRPKVGFVLSGGGSRGAYEAGIIHYLRTDLARRLGRHVPIDIVSGTSVGAINAAFLAATMADPDTQAAQIASAWRALRIEE